MVMLIPQSKFSTLCYQHFQRYLMNRCEIYLNMEGNFSISKTEPLTFYFNRDLYFCFLMGVLSKFGESLRRLVEIFNHILIYSLYAQPSGCDMDCTLNNYVFQNLVQSEGLFFKCLYYGGLPRLN